MRYFKFLVGFLLCMFLTIGTAGAVSEFNDEYIIGEWTFQNDTKFLKSITLNGTTYTTLAATDWDSIVDPNANSVIDFTDYYTSLDFGDTDHDMLTIQGTGNFGDVSVVKIEQITGNPTDGTVLEVVSADANADALIVTANATDVIQVTGGGVLNLAGGAGTLDFTDFDVSADGAVILACDLGGTMITLTPSAAAVGIDASNATLTTALNVGANDIVGTTGLINYTNFDVDAAGAIVGTALNAGAGNITTTGDLSVRNGTFTGNVNITGTFQQDNISAYTAATSLAVNGTGTGGVNIGNSSTGTINLGGGAVLVNLPATVDLTMAGGQLSITDTANADLVNLTNNTTTTGDIIEITANGVLTSGSAIKITTPAATTANVVSVTADGLTSGNIFYADSVVAGFTGAYFYAFDGANEDFSVKADGITTIAGTVGGAADSIVLTLGNLQVSSGDVDIDDGQLTVDTAQDLSNNISRNFAGAGTAAVLVVNDDNTSSTNIALDINQDGTGASTGIRIIHDGDNPALNISAGAARTGDVIAIDMTNQLNQRAIDITGAITSVAGGGTIEIHGTGIIPATASLLRLDADTAQPGNGDGYMLNVDDDTLVVAAPNAYAVLIDSNANEALHVAAGTSLFDEIATFTLGITNNGNTILGNAITDNITASAAFQGASPLILDGATDNTFEVTIGITDPLSDTTITLPDGPASSDAPVILAAGGTTTSQVGAGTSTVTGSSVAVPASHAAAGQMYRWVVGGTKTGANAAMIVHVNLYGTQVMSLTASGVTAIDWYAEFTTYIISNASQRTIGKLSCAGMVTVVDYATSAVNMAGAGNVYLQIQSQNAGDTVTSDVTRVEYNQ